MNEIKFIEYIKRKNSIDFDEQKDIYLTLLKYPFCNSLQLLLLNILKNQNNEDFDKELAKRVCHIADRRHLFAVLNNDIDISIEVQKYKSKEIENIDKDLYELQKNYAAKIDNVSTLNFSKKEYLINPSEECITSNSNNNSFTNKIIDDFIEKKPKISRLKDSKISDEIKDLSSTNNASFVSETLANIYIKQKHFDKAISVYEKLILKNPKKNAYFVDRINEIKKIINNK